METLLYNKPSFKSIWALSVAKFKLMFTKATGYDLMFEACKKDDELINSAPDIKVEEIKTTEGYSWPLMTQSIHSAI